MVGKIIFGERRNPRLTTNSIFKCTIFSYLLCSLKELVLLIAIRHGEWEPAINQSPIHTPLFTNTSDFALFHVVAPSAKLQHCSFAVHHTYQVVALRLNMANFSQMLCGTIHFIIVIIIIIIIIIVIIIIIIIILWHSFSFISLPFWPWPCLNPLEIHTIVSIKKFLLHLVTLLIIPCKEFGSFTCREVTRWKEKDTFFWGPTFFTFFWCWASWLVGIKMAKRNFRSNK